MKLLNPKCAECGGLAATMAHRVMGRTSIDVDEQGNVAYAEDGLQMEWDTASPWAEHDDDDQTVWVACENHHVWQADTDGEAAIGMAERVKNHPTVRVVERKLTCTKCAGHDFEQALVIDLTRSVAAEVEGDKVMVDHFIDIVPEELNENARVVALRCTSCGQEHCLPDELTYDLF